MSRVVLFVNEYGERPRAAAGEQGTPYPAPREVLAWPNERALPDRSELSAAADAVFPVFSAAHDGRAHDELNGLLRSVRLSPVTTASGLRWAVETSGELLLAALGTCLLGWLGDHEQNRLGTCHAAKCVDVYADASPAARRRFCSSTCLNRHKVAAHRQRSAAKRADSS